MALLILSILFFAGHLVWAGNRLMDLFTKSKRKNKLLWMLLILFMPVLGALAYNLTMKRQKMRGKTIIF